MLDVEGFIDRRGRKFFLALWISTLATIVAMLGVAYTRAEPNAGPHIAVIIGALAGVYATVAGMFGWADARIAQSAIANGIVPPHSTPPGNGPAPRPSGRASTVAPSEELL